LLGICWHVPRKEIFIKNDKMECGKCCQWLKIRPAKDEYQLTGGYEFVNPDFTTPSGIVQLLGIMRERKDWKEFYLKLYWSTFVDNYILDTTGKLRDAAINFLKP